MFCLKKILFTKNQSYFKINYRLDIIICFYTLKDVESSRSYIDEIYSSDPETCWRALVALKNSVIGSNRQKGSVIQQGIVPRLLQLLSDQSAPSHLRMEAAVTIGNSK